MGKVHFRTNALLKSIIGKDLITDDNVAVLELVKNSFDAGSQKVDIIFENILFNDDSDDLIVPSKISSKLIVKDEGVGMSQYDITEKWLNIAYSEKKEKREEFGRTMAGNKGVGRFSCDRLGRFLTIYSRTKGEDYKKLFIDWRAFEKEGEIDFNIQDVEFDIEILSEEEFSLQTGYSNYGTGTILEIACLREHWHSNKIVNLKRQLERLINPNQAFKKSEFGIKISAKEFLQHDKTQEAYNKINGIVKNKIFEKLDFRTSSIQAKIDSAGEFITTILQDRGNEIFVLKEKNPFNQLANIDVSVFYLNTYAKAYFTRQTGIKSVDFGSIFLFINGFRIPPYGDIGDDWLGMEIRKGQGYNRYLGTREIVGRIEINDDAEKFKIISNRSGIVNNIAFEQLTKSTSPFGFYYKTFRRLERFVVEGIDWDSGPEQNVDAMISDKKWDESKEKYNVDALTRNKKILSVINKIIDAKKDEIIDLQINDEFVKEIIDEQTEKAKLEFENIVNTISEKTKDLNPQDIQEVLKKISKNTSEIDDFSNLLSTHSDKSNETDSLKSIQKSFKDNYEELNLLKLELEQKLQDERDANEKAQREKEEAEEALRIEQEKNTFLRATSKGLNDDAKGLVHNIKHTSKNIRSSIDSLIAKIKSGSYKEKDIFDKLQVINFNNEKVLKIAKLITRANFKTEENSQVLDVVKYIDQYLEIYTDIFDQSELTITRETGETSFIKRLSALDIALIFDDLISNSQKAGSKKIIIEFNTPAENELNVLIHDDGIGVNDRFIENPKAMFELGVSEGTIDGSGIGLHSVRKTLKPMQAEINFVGNNKRMKGATFEITFKK